MWSDAGVERALPSGFDAPPGILGGLGTLAELRQHRVDATLQRRLSLADHLLEAAVAAAVSELLELLMRVEHQGRPREPPVRPRARRVQADDEECRAGEAECEV